jgi:hypothetical protein
MYAKAIAEALLLAVIAFAASALVPEFFQYLRMRHVKYGRRGTGL